MLVPHCVQPYHGLAQPGLQLLITYVGADLNVRPKLRSTLQSVRRCAIIALGFSPPYFEAQLSRVGLELGNALLIARIATPTNHDKLDLT